MDEPLQAEVPMWHDGSSRPSTTRSDALREERLLGGDDRLVGARTNVIAAAIDGVTQVERRPSEDIRNALLTRWHVVYHSVGD